MKKFFMTLCCLLLVAAAHATENDQAVIHGRILDAETGEALTGATVLIEGTQVGVIADTEGRFQLHFSRRAHHGGKLYVSFMGYAPHTVELERGMAHGELVIKLQPRALMAEQVEVFGERYKQPDKLDFITRMPLRPSEQIQSISIVSDKLIAQQDALTLADAARNVVGVSTFSTFGGTSESLSVRGFRGLPVLKNGVRIHSDFRGGGTLNEMQGVESIQVIKGSASITQGIGNDLASAGGVLNIATKTPKFINAGEVTLGTGSWGRFRPTFDVQNVIGKSQDFAIRINGAYERSDSYRKSVSKDRVYFNPSIAWQPDSRTHVVLEMDYLHDSRTPDRGTVNLSAMDVNNLYDMPHNKFLGFKSDRVYTNQVNYSLRVNREVARKLNFRVAVVGSSLSTDNTGASTSTLRNVTSTGDYNVLSRSIGRSERDDRNNLIQIDLVGRDVMTGPIKHTFQVGMDYRWNKLSTTSYKSVVIDTIDVLSVIPNVFEESINLVASDPETSRSYSYGVMAQDVITFLPWLKTVLGVRYSYQDSKTGTSAETVTGDAFNPMFGLILSPWKNVHIFGSYTTTTDLRSASNLLENGKPIGASTIKQFETGIKSEWINGRLRANLTLFHVMNDNLAYTIYDDAGQSTGRYGQAGDLRRQGIEIEVTGRILPNLQAIVGWAYLDVEYRNSESYMNGSRPMNAPKHTANGWLYYTVGSGALKGLSIGAGVYYVGKRPVNDYSVKYTHTGTTPGMKPFDMTSYLTVNATIGYEWRKFGLNVVFNNIFDELGYSSYARGGYINPIDPFNFSTRLSYRF